MFGIGFFELVVIAIFAIVFVGPSRLPEMMRKAGRLFVQARRMSNEVRTSVNDVIRTAEAEIQAEERKALEEILMIKQKIHALGQESTQETANSNIKAEPETYSSHEHEDDDDDHYHDVDSQHNIQNNPQEEFTVAIKPKTDNSVAENSTAIPDLSEKEKT